MASTPARPCLAPACPRIVRGTPRCPAHQREHQAQRERNRPSAQARGYGGAWARLSRSVIERDAGICYLCGLPGADTADHIVAKRNGGTDDPDNLAAAHRACNSRKGAR